MIKKLNSFLYFGAVFSFCYACYVFVNGYFCQDHAEHLHASWLVWNGEIPYRDFFEHHNPLLWFLMAPITALFYLNPYILYVSKIINASVYGFMFYGFYRIARDYLKLKKEAFGLALLLFFTTIIQVLSFFELTPDSFMYACFVWGLLYYFEFLEFKTEKSLYLSFVWFTLSFLFLQKALMMLVFVGVYTLYLLYKKEILWSVFLRALIVPGLLMGVFVFYLYYTDTLSLYFIYNFDLNRVMQKFMGYAKINDDFDVAYLYPLMTVFFIHAFCKSQNRYRYLLLGLMIGDYILKMNIWAPWVQYFIFTNFVCQLIIAQGVIQIIHQKKGVALLFLLLLIQGGFFYPRFNQNSYYYYFKMHQLIMNNQDEDDYLVNGSQIFINIFGKNPHYYWFGYQNIAPVADYLYGDEKGLDINQMIYQYKPKFVVVDSYLNFIANDPANGENYIPYLKTIYDKVPNHGEGAEAFSQHFGQKKAFYLDFDYLRAHYVILDGSFLAVRRDLII